LARDAAGAIKGGAMAKKPNHGFERSGRARQKAAKTALRLVAELEEAEDSNGMLTFCSSTRRARS
jgi:hypothetical protein